MTAACEIKKKDAVLMGTDEPLSLPVLLLLLLFCTDASCDAPYGGKTPTHAWCLRGVLLISL